MSLTKCSLVMLACLVLAACADDAAESTSSQDVCQEGDSDCCSAHPNSPSCGGGGENNPPGYMEAFAALDDWMWANGVVQDPTAPRICTPSMSVCSRVTTRTITIGTIRCDIIGVTTNGMTSVTVHCSQT